MEAMSYPVPDNEAQRLESLHAYEILDTPPEVDFDDLNNLAALICDVPVAVINLIDETREWYKAVCGVPAQHTEEPRGGICSTVICGSEILVVPDLCEDQRFCDQAAVAGAPHFRFYAGVPLINPEGYALGSLCVLDFEPKEIDIEKQEALVSLGRQVVAQFEMRRRLAELSEARTQLAEEKARADELLHNMLPDSIAEELKRGKGVEPRYHKSATIMFTDFKGFTRFAEDTAPRILVEELDRYFTAFDEIVERHGLEKLKTMGDAYMCAGGLPEENRTHAADACRAALEIQAYMTRINTQREKMRLPRWELRIGLHTGPVMAGVVGKKKFTYDIWGDAVNIAALMESHGEPGRIVVSESTHQRTKDTFEAEPRGSVETKYKGALDTYFLGPLKSGRTTKTAGGDAGAPTE